MRACFSWDGICKPIIFHLDLLYCSLYLSSFVLMNNKLNCVLSFKKISVCHQGRYGEGQDENWGKLVVGDMVKDVGHCITETESQTTLHFTVIQLKFILLINYQKKSWFLWEHTVLKNLQCGSRYILELSGGNNIHSIFTP